MQKRFNRSMLVGDDHEAGYNLSWGAIFAGVVTFFALLFTLSLIGDAIGFGMLSPTSSDPMAGVGTGVIIWTVISLILSFFGAGFVSGITARRVGLVHGFLTWALSLMLTVILLVSVLSQALSAVGSLFGNIAQGAGQVTSEVASSASDAVTESFDKVVGQIDVDQQDIDEFNGNVEQILQDTDVKELQPDYLRQQLNEASEEIGQAAKKVVTEPESADKTLDTLMKNLDQRVEGIAENVDQDAVTNAIYQNSNLNQQEAQEATQNIVEGYEKAAKSTREQLQKATAELDQARVDLEQDVKQLRQGADKASTTAMSTSIWAFVGVVIGAVLAVFGGILGTRFVTEEITETRS